MRTYLCFALCCVLFTTCLQADDWPQWMGPTRNGLWQEKGLLRKFPEAGPKIKWRVPTALGYAGPAVADNRVFLFDYLLDHGAVKNSPQGRVKLQGKERLRAFDAATGAHDFMRSIIIAINERSICRTYGIKFL